MKLSVNIDHVATLRQVRGGSEPNLKEAIAEVLKAGADGITVHLRQDLRHIQPDDLKMIRSTFQIPLNVELAVHANLDALFQHVIPSTVTLVPEHPHEVTTEGGLQVNFDPAALGVALKTLKKEGIQSSLFVDPDPTVIRQALLLHPDAIEINTNHYSLQPLDSPSYLEALEKIKECSQLIHNHGVRVLAGHGLNRNNVEAISKISVLDELNIGHSIVARSLYVGLQKAVREILTYLK